MINSDVKFYLNSNKFKLDHIKILLEVTVKCMKMQTIILGNYL